MLDYLYRWDLFLLHLFNVKLANPYMDLFWLEITNMHKQMWFRAGLAPLLAAAAVYIYRTEVLKIVVALVIAVGLSDTLAYRGVKSAVDRQRPFQNEEISWVRKAGEAHGRSFPSNHAANVFAAAAVLAWFFPPWVYGFYIFAGLIAMSRVALGVHFPSDALAGMILGIIVGYLVRILILNRVKWFRLGGRVSSADGISSVDRTRTRRLQ
jgi:undecaprenyl-diphosphatase